MRRPRKLTTCNKLALKKGYYRPPATAQTELEIVAARGDYWLQVRRGSASGPLVYEGILERGRSVSFADRRLWLRFAVGDHLDVTVNGKRVTGFPLARRQRRRQVRPRPRRRLKGGRSPW